MALGFGFDLMSQATRQRPWTPRYLFGDGEQGAWYDPSDFASLYQDSAGTTPVTALGQPVGLMLDKSQGAKPTGPELVDIAALPTPSITDFGGSSGAWNPATSSFSNQAVGTDSSYPRFGFDFGLTSGVRYMVSGRLSGDIDKLNNTRPLSLAAFGNANNVGYSSATGVFSGVQVADGSRLYFLCDGRELSDITIEELSIREIPGNHASQSTSTARPTLQARVNLLERTEDFSPTYWSVTATNDGSTFAAPDGSSTAVRFSGAGIVQSPVALPAGQYTASFWARASSGSPALAYSVSRTDVAYSFPSLTSDWQKYTITQTATGSGTSSSVWSINFGGATGTVDIWHPQLEVGTSATTYQRVTTATDYEDIGLPRYLEFDGVDDALSTASVDFTGTDKMTVCAGMEPEVGDKMAFELSPNLTANDGSFYMYLTSSSYSFASRGTIADAITPGGITYPTKNVVTGLGDISAPSAILRVDQSQSVSSTTQGTGNYGNHSFYIGVRATSSLYFNGYLHQLIIRGATTSGALLDAVERYVANKTGVTL